MPDVTIATTTTQLKWQGGDAPTLIIEAAAPFLTAAGVPVNNGGGPFRAEYATTVNGSGYVVIPAVTLPSTEDSSVPSVTYVAFFQKANAYDPASRTPFSTFGPFRGFRVPVDTPTTWEELDANMGSSIPLAGGDRHVGGDLSWDGVATGDGSGITDTDARKLRGRDVGGGAPSDGQVLGWNDTTEQWEPQAAGATVSGGNATQLQGRAVSATAPTAGQALVYDTDISAWRPGTVSGGLFDVKGSFGAVGDGTANDTAAINAAIAALNAAGGGVLYFPFGDYKVTAALTTITVPFAVVGDGHANTNGGTWITRIFTTSTTANLFTVTAAKGLFRDIAIVNDAATAPTAGAGILVTTPGLPTPTPAELGNQIDFERVYVGFFYDDVVIESGAIWHMSGSTISHPVRYGMRVNNLNYLDAGDWTINQSTFEQAVYQSESALFVESSGGGRITNVKVNGAGGASGDLSFNNPFHFNLSTTASTGILLISNTSIENSRGDGIKIQNGYHLICISNCQFGLYGNTTGELIHLSNVKNVTIDNIVAQQSNATPANLAFRIENSENVQIGQYSLKYYSFAVSFDGTYVPEGTGDTPKFLTTASFATLQNGWSNLAGHAPSGFGYFNGEVHLRGAIQGGTTTSGTLLFTLPVGFRPTYAHTFAVHNLNSSTHGTAIIEVATNGQVKVYGAAGSTLLSFNGVRFVP